MPTANPAPKAPQPTPPKQANAQATKQAKAKPQIISRQVFTDFASI